MSLKKTHRFEPKNEKPGRIYEWEKIIYKSELSKVYKGQMRIFGKNLHEKVCYVVIKKIIIDIAKKINVSKIFLLKFDQMLYLLIFRLMEF